MKKSLLILIGLLNPIAVAAYIDPGTAGMIVGGSIWPMILAFFAAISAFIIKRFWHPIKNSFSRIKQKKESNSNG